VATELIEELICAIAGKARNVAKGFISRPSRGRMMPLFKRRIMSLSGSSWSFAYLRCPFAHHKMQDQRNHREYEQ